jgi:hypothetical protein
MSSDDVARDELRSLNHNQYSAMPVTFRTMTFVDVVIQEMTSWIAAPSAVLFV